MSDGFVKVAEVGELRDDAGIQRTVGDREVGLFRDGEGVLAIDAICPHVGGPLGEGFVEDGHGWPFDLKTGKCKTNSRAKVECFQAKVENGEVYVRVPK
jgi:nitrite reductase/ring-hydroxylating ferredoxin subunit